VFNIKPMHEIVLRYLSVLQLVLATTDMVPLALLLLLLLQLCAPSVCSLLTSPYSATCAKLQQLWLPAQARARAQQDVPAFLAAVKAAGWRVSPFLLSTSEKEGYVLLGPEGRERPLQEQAAAPSSRAAGTKGSRA
jgi:hypothetical protein